MVARANDPFRPDSRDLQLAQPHALERERERGYSFDGVRFFRGGPGLAALVMRSSLHPAAVHIASMLL